VALALRAWIAAKRAELPFLHYVVLAGDDRIVPHLRQPIGAPTTPGDGWVGEREYFDTGVVGPGSGVGRALASDLTLTDDVYGAAGPRAWGDRTLWLPDLAVGRLVERPSDMTATIDAFLALGGELEVRRSLVAGYDFMQDALDASDGLLARRLGDGQRTRLFDLWSVDALRAALFGTRQDVAMLAVHAAHYAHEAPDGGRVTAAEVVGAPADLAGTLVTAVACHAGLNVPGPNHPEPLDFPEAWARRGATFVGSTGWAYGEPHVTAYQEALMADLTRELVVGGSGAIGDALVAAKQRYYREHPVTRLHVQTLAGTMLYGLPMLRVSLPDRPAAGLAALGAARAGGRPAERAAAPEQVKAALWVKPDPYPIAAEDLARVQTVDGDYYTFSGLRPWSESGEPVQPKLVHRVGEHNRDGQILTLRGAVMTGATYRQLPGFRPLVARAQTLGVAQDDPPAAPAFDPPSWFPTVPVQVHGADWTEQPGGLVVGSTEATVLLSAGQYSTCLQSERLFSEILLDDYYTASADRTPPTIQSVAEALAGAATQVTVEVADDGTVLRVAATYDDGRGAWRTVDLALDPGTKRWLGTVPAGAPYFVQAVDEGGNVSVDDNEGRYHGPAPSCRPAKTVHLPFAER